MNSVNYILSVGDNRNLECKLELKKLGPPRPKLTIAQEQKGYKNKNCYIRKFNPSLYKYADWLCGCDVRNAFFCYTCLVMNVSDHVWTSAGISDIKHLGEKVKKHSVSEKHINGGIEFAMLGKVDIRCQLNTAYRLKIKQFNEEVGKNRYILGKLIDAIKFCGKFELALRGHNETETSDNPGIFRGLINLMAELDTTLKEHIEKTNNRVFLGLSKTIQNDLLNSIYTVCRQIICNEISQTQYIAIEVDETTDCATLSQLVFVVRYELNGKINERFISFVLPNNHTAEGISSAIFNELGKLNIDKSPEKVIGQSYDGASVMSGQHTGVQARVKAVYKNAHFVHCYAHQLNLIVERCAAQTKEIRIFFSNLDGFSSFFSKSAKRTSVLDEKVNKRIPKNAATRWNFRDRCVSTVYAYRNEILECLETIISDDSNEYSTTRKAVGLSNMLKDPDFLFWLEFFSKVMPHSEILFQQLQSREIDSVKAHKNISDFKFSIQLIRNSLDHEHHWHAHTETTTTDVSPCPSQKRTRFETTRNVVAKEVCDVILAGIDDRFMFTDHLSVAKLLQPTLFSKHRILFPEIEFQKAIKLFGLNQVQLRHELTVLYGRSDFQNASGALTLLTCIYENELQALLSESVKLLRIICTIPMTTSESERCFSTLKRIKSYTRNTMKEDRLNALAMCSIEKQLLATHDFNELVIDHFSQQKERRMDFIYKPIN